MQTKPLTLAGFFKRTLLTAALLALVVSIMTPVGAAGLTTDTTTAKSNETSTNNILGGVPTRVTWEAVADEGDSISHVKLVFPDGTRLSDESTVRVTLLDGTERMKDMATATINTGDATVDVVFNEPFGSGLRLRIETYKVELPNIEGQVTLSGTYTNADGTVHQLGESPAITLTKASTEERVANWLEEKPWVQKWNSVKFLKLFFNPVLVVKSLATVAHGWLLSLLLVIIGFPLAIPLGLIASFMKIGRFRPLHVIANIYTGVIRGTPLFLQIYIAFFGMPLLGLPLNTAFAQYALAICVLAFNSGAYLCEIFRAGIQSIPKGQFEASRSLGMNSRQTMFSVIIPQAFRRVIPTMTSEFILLYKDTSLLAAVGVMELMLYSRSIVAVTGNMTPYIVAACFYLVVTLPLIRVVTILENRLAHAEGGQGSTKKKRKKRFGKKEQSPIAAAALAGSADMTLEMNEIQADKDIEAEGGAR